MSAVLGDKNNHRFIAGTCSLKEKNEVYLLNFNEDDSKITCEGVFEHPNEIWSLSACPLDPNLFISCSSTEDRKYSIKINSMNLLTEEHTKAPDYDSSTPSESALNHSNIEELLPLETTMDFGEFSHPLRSVLWDDEEQIEAAKQE